MKLISTARALSFCVFLLAGAVPAHATPFSVSVPVSGARGAAITTSLFDEGVSGLEAADFVLTFDSDVFTYSAAVPGSATSGFSLGAGNPVSAGSVGFPSLFQVVFSLATGGGSVNGVSGSLVDVYFQINPGATLGTSILAFESTQLSDYFIPSTSGTVMVTQGQPGTVPEPASSMLLGIGILALAACRRRLR